VWSSIYYKTRHRLIVTQGRSATLNSRQHPKNKSRRSAGDDVRVKSIKAATVQWLTRPSVRPSVRLSVCQFFHIQTTQTATVTEFNDRKEPWCRYVMGSKCQRSAWVRVTEIELGLALAVLQETVYRCMRACCGACRLNPPFTKRSHQVLRVVATPRESTLCTCALLEDGDERWIKKNLPPQQWIILKNWKALDQTA